MAAPSVDELLQCLKDSHATSDAVSAAFDPHDFVFNKRGYQSVIRINGCSILPPLVSLFHFSYSFYIISNYSELQKNKKWIKV